MKHVPVNLNRVMRSNIEREILKCASGRKSLTAIVLHDLKFVAWAKRSGLDFDYMADTASELIWELFQIQMDMVAAQFENEKSYLRNQLALLRDQFPVFDAEPDTAE